MPFTPYHFGPNGFVGLVFKKWLDLPALLLANVIIDIEVLFRSHRVSGPLTHWNLPHQVFHFHTLLIGGLVGALLGFVLYPWKGLLGKIMSLVRLPYKPTLLKMVLSGILGAWLHVIIDSIYHRDVEMFWPDTKLRPLWNKLTQTQVKYLCIAFALAATLVYIFHLAKELRKKKQTTSHKDNENAQKDS
ncbi:MAG: hypothetical protein JW804_01400 [Sedimentisphaerales bacterium]|nr:hypothetical protein [Sedimentisphaerales bacterium]